MLNIVKAVIESGNFELTSILNKIDKLWFENRLTDEERTLLVEQAQGKANPQNSIDVYKKLEEMDKRILELENKLKNGADLGDESTEETYPVYEAGKWYYTGDKITFEEKVYECIAPNGVVCVWSPKDYPTYWKELN